MNTSAEEKHTKIHEIKNASGDHVRARRSVKTSCGEDALANLYPSQGDYVLSQVRPPHRTTSTYTFINRIVQNVAVVRRLPSSNNC